MIGSRSVRPVVSTGGQLIGGFPDTLVGEVVQLSDPLCTKRPPSTRRACYQHLDLSSGRYYLVKVEQEENVMTPDGWFV